MQVSLPTVPRLDPFDMSAYSTHEALHNGMTHVPHKPVLIRHHSCHWVAVRWWSKIDLLLQSCTVVFKASSYGGYGILWWWKDGGNQDDDIASEHLSPAWKPGPPCSTRSSPTPLDSMMAIGHFLSPVLGSLWCVLQVDQLLVNSARCQRHKTYHQNSYRSLIAHIHLLVITRGMFVIGGLPNVRKHTDELQNALVHVPEHQKYIHHNPHYVRFPNHSTTKISDMQEADTQ